MSNPSFDIFPWVVKEKNFLDEVTESVENNTAWVSKTRAMFFSTWPLLVYDSYQMLSHKNIRSQGRINFTCAQINFFGGQYEKNFKVVSFSTSCQIYCTQHCGKVELVEENMHGPKF